MDVVNYQQKSFNLSSSKIDLAPHLGDPPSHASLKDVFVMACIQES